MTSSGPWISLLLVAKMLVLHVILWCALQAWEHMGVAISKPNRFALHPATRVLGDTRNQQRRMWLHGVVGQTGASPCCWLANEPLALWPVMTIVVVSEIQVVS